MNSNKRLFIPSVLRPFLITDIPFFALIHIRRRIYAATSVLLFLALGWVPLSHADGANVVVDGGGISATATVNASSMTLRVGGPGGFADEVRSNSGYVSWNLPGPLLDGTYHYDVYTTVGSQSSPDPDSDQSSENVILYRQSGSFDVLGGAVAPSPGGEWGAATDVVPQERPWLARLGTALLDLVFPAANAADLTASSTAPRVNLDDTEVGVANSPEWRLEALEAIVFQEVDFRLTDVLGGGTVLQVRPSANTNQTFTVDLNGDIHLANDTVFIDRSLDRLGVGTATPVAPLHIVNSSPSILLDSGVQSFPIGGSDDFLISHDNGTDTIPVMNVENSGAQRGWVSFGRGQIGFPGAPLEVFRGDGTARLRVEEFNAVVSPRNLFELINNGPIGFNMTDTSLGQTWRFASQTTGFRVSLDGTGGPEMEVGNGGTLTAGPGGKSNLFLDDSGNLTITGSLSQSSDRAAKTHITPLSTPEVLSRLTALPVSQWAYKNTPTVTHIGPMAQDFKAAFGLGADDKHLAPGDLAGVAVVGVQGLHKMIETRDARISALEGRLAELEATLARVLVERTTRLAVAHTAPPR